MEIDPPVARKRQASELSYKFQRLRERLRAAVASGELSGKLPGERALAKRFHVNAKTLSKALTDLAAEGLLDRSIGRGTYVKGTGTDLGPKTKTRWLVVSGAQPLNNSLGEAFRSVNADTDVWSGDVAAIRPSHLASVNAVISLDPATPAAFMKDTIVRNITVVAVGYVPRTYSTHCIVPDAALGAAALARELVLAGHRRIVVIERDRNTGVAAALRVAARRIAPDAVVDALDLPEAQALIGHGATAVVCDCPQSAKHVRRMMDDRGVSIPGQVSLAAVGAIDADPPCSGFFTTQRHVVTALTTLLRDPPSRPTALWLSGDLQHRGTIAEAESVIEASEMASSMLLIPRIAVA